MAEYGASTLKGENEPKIVATMLCGIASSQIDDRKIASQGWDRLIKRSCLL